MTNGDNKKKNFEVYTAEEFMASHSISLRDHFRTCAELDSVWYATMDGIQTRLPSGQVNHEESVKGMTKMTLFLIFSNRSKIPTLAGMDRQRNE